MPLTHRPFLGSVLAGLTLAAASLAGPALADGHGAKPAEAPVGNLETFLQPEFLPGSLRNMTTLFPARTVSRDGAISAFKRAEAEPALSYRFSGVDYSVDDFMVRTRASGLMVIKDGVVLTERYGLGADETSSFTSWSVAKSFTSTLVGLALGKGLIDSLDDPLGKYIPALKGQAYADVSIKHALQMSSGIQFTERYGDGESDVMKFFGGGVVENRFRVNEFMASRPKAVEAGTKFSYSTGETQVLGWLVASVTGKTVSDFLSEEIWQKLGMEHDATWLVDQRGGDAMEVTGCCLNVTLRDYARFGLLMLQDGVWDGERILPEGWVKEASQPQDPYVANGALDPEGEYPLGYGYQWWTFPGEDKAYTAQGIHGQFIYVNPAENLVAVVTSAWPEAWSRRNEYEVYAMINAFEEL